MPLKLARNYKWPTWEWKWASSSVATPKSLNCALTSKNWASIPTWSWNCLIMPHISKCSAINFHWYVNERLWVLVYVLSVFFCVVAQGNKALWVEQKIIFWWFEYLDKALRLLWRVLLTQRLFSVWTWQFVEQCCSVLFVRRARQCPFWGSNIILWVGKWIFLSSVQSAFELGSL